MTLMLCRQCLNWESPQYGRCPFCTSNLNLAEPDLTVSELATRFGTVLLEQPSVAIQRRQSLVHGSLILTSIGLAWMPEIEWIETHRIGFKTSSHRTWWSLRFSWSPRPQVNDRTARPTPAAPSNELMTPPDVDSRDEKDAGVTPAGIITASALATRWMERPTSLWLPRTKLVSSTLQGRTMHLIIQPNSKVSFFQLGRPTARWPTQVENWFKDHMSSSY